jgi:cellulose synthase/poly-beta-1,6-N-acetylglucosamine synthase-like glycosyltransferase
MTSRLIFWTSAALIVYTYVGYPALLWLLQFAFRKPVRKAAIEPGISLLISAYNEAQVIASKVRNSLALDYPPEKLEIVVASDGSTDDTATIVRALAQQEGGGRIRLLEFSENRGKISALNDSVPELHGELVVFSDASSMLATDSVRQLAANFADPEVGAASGVYQVLNTDGAKLGRQEDLYWKYETFLKLQEAKLGTLTGAHGSLYAMRRALYPFPPARTINDDFVIPTSVLRRGYRIAYEPQAVAYEEAQEMEGFGRRVRISAGNLSQLRAMAEFFWPPRPFLLFCFLSHKAARLLVPFAMIALAVASAMLWQLPFYRWLGLAQIAFYVAATLGAFRLLPWKPLRLPYYFCMINASLFVSIFYLLTGRGRKSSSKRPGVAW